MTKKLQSLRRIEAVQKKMVRLSEVRIALADQACRDIEADRIRLRAYIVDQGSLGVELGRAALKSLEAVEQRHARAKVERETQKRNRDALKKREHLVATMADKAEVVARRSDEDRALAITMDAWLITRDASLP